MDGVEEVHAGDAGWTLRGPGNTRNGQRRGIGRENRVVCNQRVEPLKERLLHREVFDNRLDHQIRIADGHLKIRGRRQVRHGRIRLRLRQLASADCAGQIRLDAIPCAGQRIRVRIRQPRLVARHRRHLRDTMAHRACADHRNPRDL